MGLLHRLRRRRMRRGDPLRPPARTDVPRRRRIPIPTTLTGHTLALLPLVLLLGFGIFWLTSAPADAVTTTTTPGGTTTTTVFKLSKPVQTQVDALTAQAQAVQAQLDALQEQLEEKTEEYNKCQEDLAGANARMAELRRKMADAQADKARQQALLAQRIKKLYMSGGRDQLLQLLLLANGMNDLYNRVRLVATVADQDQHLVSDLKASTGRLDLLVQAVEQQKQQALQLSDELAQRATEIDATIAERDQTLNGLDARVAAIVEQERQRQKEEQERLQAELEARLAAEAAAAAAAAQNRIVNGGQAYNGKLPQIDDEIQRQLVETAMAYLGIVYVWGGSKPSSGMDCSGFTRWVYRQHGVNLPHYSGYQARMGLPVDPAHMQPGDLLAFGFPVHHVGIYIGNGLYIHTPDHVKISRLSARNDLSAVRRFPLRLRIGAPLFN